MDKNTYTIVGKFKCCGKTMVTVIIEDKAVCVMSELAVIRLLRKSENLGRKTD